MARAASRSIFLGETTWFEGLLLVGVYVLFGVAFFFSGGG